MAFSDYTGYLSVETDSYHSPANRLQIVNFAGNTSQLLSTWEPRLHCYYTALVLVRNHLLAYDQNWGFLDIFSLSSPLQPQLERSLRVNMAINRFLIDENIAIAVGDNHTWILDLEAILSPLYLYSPRNLCVSLIGSEVTLSWDVVEHALGYRVLSDPNPTGGFTADVSDQGSFSIQDGRVTWIGPLPDGEKRFYHVTAVNN
jgi:hypothetical protein